MTEHGDPDPQRPRGLTRRGVLAAGGALGLAAAAGGVGYAVGQGDDDQAAPARDVVAFHGEHQAGVATPAQARLVFGAFDLVSDDAGALRELLQTWTAAAARMTAGRPTGAVAGAPALPPRDTGEAEGLGAARLSITLGLGPELFERRGEDRMGLLGRRPSALKPLGPLPGDQLDPQRTGGDLCVQACADDPQVAFHAVRNLLRAGRGTVELRWMQLGFGSNTKTTVDQPTPRNLMGFKDGTRNIKVEDTAKMDRYVWVDPKESQAWFRGGTYLVARRIRMLIESWDRTALAEQERVIGREKVSGAPLGGRREDDTPRLAGRSRIDVDAHIRLAAPSSNADELILRRGYAYTDGVDPRTGLLDAGLFFICFQRDPERQFVAIQRRLGTVDALAEYIQHTGGGLFAIPPGAGPGGFVGEGLFA